MSLGATLKRIREMRYLTADQVTTSTGISPARFDDFEEDRRKPSLKQLEKLAAIYGVQPYSFYGDIPNLPDLLPDFRRSSPRPAKLSPGGLGRIWAAEQRSQFSNQLANELEWSAPKWALRVPEGRGDVRHAETLRAYFDRWSAPRAAKFAFAGPRDQVFLQTFRLFMEVQGLVINFNEAQPNDYMGFYVQPEDGFPLAFINRKISSKKAQLFTLVHEVTHHILRKEGVSDPFVVKNSVERTCNQFAAAFLAPMDAFLALAREVPQSDRQDTFRYVRIVSERTLLSLHATAIRLAEAGLLSERRLAMWQAAQQPASRAEKDEEEGASGGASHAKRIGELGYLPTSLAAQAVRKKIVDALDVQRGLALSRSQQDKAFALAERRVAEASI